MEEQVFDAVAFARFDLSAGEIRSCEDGALLMLPPEVAAEVAPSARLSAASRQWGQLHGRGLRSALDIRGGEASMELLSQHLCGTVAVLGLGRLSLAVYGNALLLRVPSNGPATSSKGLLAVFCGFAAGYLAALTDQPFEVVPLGEQGGQVVLFAGNANSAAVVARLVASGSHVSDIVTRLSTWSVA